MVTFNKTKIYQTFTVDVRTLVVKNPNMGPTRGEAVAKYKFQTKNGEKIRREIKKAFPGYSVRMLKGVDMIDSYVNLGKIDSFFRSP